MVESCIYVFAVGLSLGVLNGVLIVFAQYILDIFKQITK